jgi:homoserine kinase type II
MAPYTELDQQDIHRIAGRYGLAVLGFEPIERGACNSNFLLRAPQGSYVLTVFEEKTLAEATRIARVLQLLAEHAFPTTRPLSLDEGGTITLHRGKPVMVKEFIPGRVHRHLDATMLRQVGAAAARMHQIPVPGFLPAERPYGVEVFLRTSDGNIDPEFEAWATERIASLERRIPAGLPCGLIHGDLFYDNVVFVDRKLRAVIDMENVIPFHLAFDLGLGFIGLCREGLTVSLDRARELVNGYLQVRGMDERERETLQLFVEYAAVAISCWRFWKYHIQSPRPDRADKHRRMAHSAREISRIPHGEFVRRVFP